MKVLTVQRKSGGYDIPQDGIILWYGTASQIPSGFVIYSDLNGYFPYGGSSADLTARGASTHVHSFPSTPVSAHVSHTHSVPAGNVSDNVGGSNLGWSTDGVAGVVHGHSVTASGNVTGGGTDSGTHTIDNTGSSSSIPKSKKYYYIRATTKKPLPIGGILIWKNTEGVLPNGCYVCNGSNGTINLQDYFIQGASSDGEVGSTVSSGSHTHTRPANTNNNSNSHTHSITISLGGSGQNNDAYGCGYPECANAVGNHGHSGGTGNTGARNPATHSHSLGGSTNAQTNLPPHMKLYYIMRVE